MYGQGHAGASFCAQFPIKLNLPTANPLVLGEGLQSASGFILGYLSPKSDGLSNPGVMGHDPTLRFKSSNFPVFLRGAGGLFSLNVSSNRFGWWAHGC